MCTIKRDLDLYTLEYITHLFAGKLSNCRRAVSFLKKGRTHLSGGKSLTSVLSRDLVSINDTLMSLKSRAVIVNNIDLKRDRVIVFAKAVVTYPKGSSGYNPVDLINLSLALGNLENLEHNLGI